MEPREEGLSKFKESIFLGEYIICEEYVGSKLLILDKEKGTITKLLDIPHPSYKLKLEKYPERDEEGHIDTAEFLITYYSENGEPLSQDLLHGEDNDLFYQLLEKISRK